MKIENEKLVVPQWFDEWYKTFNGNKTNALYFLNRIGWGYDLTDYNERKVERYSDKIYDSFGDWGFENAKEYLSKAILFGYEVKQEPLYYARIKGWELLGVDCNWVYIKNSKEFIVGEMTVRGVETDMMTKLEWNEIGIDDTNADFREV